MEKERITEEVAEPGGVEGLDTPLVLLVGVISALFVFVIIIASVAYYYAEERRELDKKVYSARYEEVSGIKAGQLAEIEGYRVIDPANGICTIPIEEAMKQIGEEEKAKQSTKHVMPPPGGGHAPGREDGK